MNSLRWQQLEQFLAQYQLSDRPLWIALSGGVDSVGLLHLAYQLQRNTKRKVKAIHVNHGLSKNADIWQQQVSSLCQSLHIELVVKQVHIEAKSRTSLEQQARDARYQAIAEALPANSVLFTGHHQADQFETFILRLMRSSGLTGLTSMKSVTDLPNALAKTKQLLIARPLLNTTKAEVLEYAEQHKLEWVEDESNQDQKFDRNFVRASLLPLFQQRWPNATAAVETSSALLQQDAELLSEYLQQDLNQMLVTAFAGQAALDLSLLLQQPSNKQLALVRMFVNQQSALYPSRNTLAELFNQLSSCRDDSQPELRLTKDVSLNVYDQKLFVINRAEQQPENTDLVANESQNLVGSRLYRTVKVIGQVEGTFAVKFGLLSDKLQPNLNSGSKKVKALLKQHKCPPWNRAEVPLIYLDGQLIAVADLVTDKAHKHNITIAINEQE